VISEITTKFHGVQYKVQSGTKTVNYDGGCFTVEEDITTGEQLEKEVKQHVAINNLHYQVGDWLDLAGLPNHYEIVETIEEQMQNREIYILAYVDGLKVQGDIIKIFSNRAEKFFKVDKEGNIVS